MEISFKFRRNQLTAILLVLIILISNVFNYSRVKAEDGDWGVLPDDPNKSFTDTTITWTELHYLGDDDRLRYYTYKYSVSKLSYDLYSSFNEGSNAAIEHYFISVQQRPGNYKDLTHRYFEYTVQKDEIMDAAYKLGVTPEDVLNGTGQVWLNPIYKTYIGDYNNNANIVDDWVFGLTAMKAEASWSQNTLHDLPGFYNKRLSLSRTNVYTVQIKPVDNKMHSLSGAKNQGGYTVGDTFNLPESKQHLMCKSPYEYVLTDTNRTLTKDVISYRYSHWDYEYDKRADGSSSLTSITNNLTLPINFSGPDAQGGTMLTIYIVYEPEEPTTYKAKVIAENPDKTYLMDLKSETEVTSGLTTYQYTITTPKTMKDGKEYNYQDSCYLTYTKPDGTLGTINNITSTKQINYDMPTAKEGSTAVFHVIYDKVQTIPTPTPLATPTPSPPEVIVPDPATETLPFTTVVNTGILRADVRGSEKFIATQGVPTTESLYGEVLAKKYLLGYTFEKKVGKQVYNVKVTKNYILKWYSNGPDSKETTVTVPITRVIQVPRAYGYWEITNLECYKIDNAVIKNYALQNGSTTIYPNMSYYSPPAVSVNHSTSLEDHVLPPDEVDSGIVLEDETITAPEGKETIKPNIPDETELFEYEALCQTGNAYVKSDSVIFNGATVMSNEIVETETPYVNTAAIPQCYDNISNNVLYKPGNVIPATKQNGSYPTTGTITYTKIAKINSYKGDNLQYSIEGLNSIVIHTPVVCVPSITADNDKYVQLINPAAGCVELVLDPDPRLSDFTVHISNTAFHTGIQGYFTRDFSKSLRDPKVSYIASENGLLMNQVKFPFDVYIDTGKANDSSDDDFIKAGTWVTIDRAYPRFYLPMTVNEGVYTVNFRTIAVNGKPFINKTEQSANTQRYNYVATDSMNVEISGRIYGLSIYDISDYPMWREAFRVPNSFDLKKDNSNYPDGTSLSSYSAGRSYYYTLGTNDQYGNDTGRNNKYTFPLVNGSHPEYKNQGILKTGYLFRFSLETTGNMFSDACMVSIKPNFYFVDKDGKNRVAVDLYYSEEINKKAQHLVKVGSAIDQTNLKNVMTGDLNLAIPEKELKQTAELRGMSYDQFIFKYSPMFNFSNIRLNWAFRTYTNTKYLSKVKSYDSYADVLAKGISDGNILERMQRWYGQYYLPNEVHAAEKGFDVMDYADKYGVDYSEDFWLTDGYIIVNFTIETVGENGSRRLSYINYPNYRDNGNCSMWVMEGPVPSKKSYKGPTINFYAGDIMVYYANKKMSDDYHTGAIY